jgi:hypothetical protein
LVQQLQWSEFLQLHGSKSNAKKLEEPEIHGHPDQILLVHPIRSDSSNQITECDMTLVHAIFIYPAVLQKEMLIFSFVCLGDDDS